MSGRGGVTAMRAIAPRGRTEMAGFRRITVTWAAVAGATGYDVYYSNTDGYRRGAASRRLPPCSVGSLAEEPDQFAETRAQEVLGDQGERPAEVLFPD